MDCGVDDFGIDEEFDFDDPLEVDYSQNNSTKPVQAIQQDFIDEELCLEDVIIPPTPSPPEVLKEVEVTPIQPPQPRMKLQTSPALVSPKPSPSPQNKRSTSPKTPFKYSPLSKTFQKRTPDPKPAFSSQDSSPSPPPFQYTSLTKCKYIYYNSFDQMNDINLMITAPTYIKDSQPLVASPSPPKLAKKPNSQGTFRASPDSSSPLYPTPKPIIQSADILNEEKAYFPTPTPTTPKSNPRPGSSLLSCDEIPTGKRRRIPGPAGAIADTEITGNLRKKQKVDKENNVCLVGGLDSKKNDMNELAFFHDFRKGPWLTMLCAADLPPFENPQHDCLLKYNIASLKRRGVCCRVEAIVVLVKDIQIMDTVCIVSLKDPTGSIKGHIHQLVMETYPSEILAGSVLVLRKVAVFSPSPFEHILNITVDNIVRIFDSKLPRPIEYGSVSNEQNNLHPSNIYMSPTGKGVTFDTNSLLSPKQIVSKTPTKSKSPYPVKYPPPSPQVSLKPNPKTKPPPPILPNSPFKRPGTS